MDITGLGSFFDLGGKIIDKVFPDALKSFIVANPTAWAFAISGKTVWAFNHQDGRAFVFECASIQGDFTT